jgi:hypothetical protein
MGDVIRPEGKRPLEKTRHRWEDWLRMDMGIGWGLWNGFNWLRIGVQYYAVWSMSNRWQ